jgi:Skp family chaperone for outer membrane proteins
VKRKVVLVAGLAALAVGLYVGTRVTAKTNETPAAPSGQTRVAVMNMSMVAEEYTRTNVIKQELTKLGAQLETPLKQLQKDLQTATTPTANPTEAEANAKKARDLRRQLEDQSNDAKKTMTDRTQEGEQAIYKDIEAAVAAFAKSRNIDLVLCYNDVSDAAQKYNAGVLQKRIAASGMPIYAPGSTEISKDIAHVLNYNWELNHPKVAGSGSR